MKFGKPKHSHLPLTIKTASRPLTWRPFKTKTKPEVVISQPMSGVSSYSCNAKLRCPIDGNC